jgi:putative Ca2+/H+ antiporter (TMEM165/GDT1 family)
LATLINHGLSAWLGVWLANLVPMNWLQIFLGASFIALGLWMLVPDKDEELGNGRSWGPFAASFVLFFLAEIGDKTQIATIALGARFPDEFASVLTGTTLGMVAANVPVIWLGAKLTNPRWETWAHRISALLFVLFGVLTLVLSEPASQATPPKGRAYLSGSITKLWTGRPAPAGSGVACGASSYG